MSRNILTVLIAGLGLSMAACGGAQGDGPLAAGLSGKGDGKAAAIIITEAQNGQTFQAAVGDTVEVWLEGNPTTGYQWELLTNSRSLPLQDSGYIPDAPELTGSGGHYYFVFKPDMFGQGETFKLELAYARSWEPAPIKTFSFTLQVTPACMPVMCELYCENGFTTDDNGCEICVCN